MTWQVEFDVRFSGWIVTDLDGTLIARFETEPEARKCVEAVNAMTSLARVLEAATTYTYARTDAADAGLRTAVHQWEQELETA